MLEYSFNSRPVPASSHVVQCAVIWCHVMHDCWGQQPWGCVCVGRGLVCVCWRRMVYLLPSKWMNSGLKGSSGRQCVSVIYHHEGISRLAMSIIHSEAHSLPPDWMRAKHRRVRYHSYTLMHSHTWFWWAWEKAQFYFLSLYVVGYL